MHTFRLLAMAEEIGREGAFKVFRPDREYLLRIKRGEFEYEDLMKQAEQKLAEIGQLYKGSALPDTPDGYRIEQLLIAMRKELYG